MLSFFTSVGLVMFSKYIASFCLKMNKRIALFIDGAKVGLFFKTECTRISVNIIHFTEKRTP